MNKLNTLAGVGILLQVACNTGSQAHHPETDSVCPEVRSEISEAVKIQCGEEKKRCETVREGEKFKEDRINAIASHQKVIDEISATREKECKTSTNSDNSEQCQRINKALKVYGRDQQDWIDATPANCTQVIDYCRKRIENVVEKSPYAYCLEK